MGRVNGFIGANHRRLYAAYATAPWLRGLPTHAAPFAFRFVAVAACTIGAR